LLTTREAGELLQISATWIRRLVDAGFIEMTGRDQVRLISAVQGYVRHLKDDQRRASKSASLSRVQDARASGLELRNAEREGRLMDIEEVREIVADWAGKLKTGLDSVPAQVAADDRPTRDKIEQAIDGVLLDVASHFEQAIGKLVEGAQKAAR